MQCNNGILCITVPMELLFRGCLAGIVQCKETLAECSLEMYSQSEDQQADCLSKNASIIHSYAFLRVSACHAILLRKMRYIDVAYFREALKTLELNYTALANEALVSDIAQYLC